MAVISQNMEEWEQDLRIFVGIKNVLHRDPLVVLGVFVSCEILGGLRKRIKIGGIKFLSRMNILGIYLFF